MMSHKLNSAKSKSFSTGFFWLNSAETWVDVSRHAIHAPLFQPNPYSSTKVDLSDRTTTTHWFSESGVMDFFVLLGPEPKTVMKQYGMLTGTQSMLQQFALGYHQCRWNYIDTLDVQQVHNEFENLDIPVDVIWLDIEHTDDKRYFTWHGTKFAEPVKLQEELAAKGRKMVTIIDPHIKRDDNYYVKKEGSEKGLFVRNPQGQEFEGWCWSGSSSYIDFTNPDARKWWSSLFLFNKYQGSTENLFTWNDMNEPSVFNSPEITMAKDNLHWEDWEHRDVHNIYGMYLVSDAVILLFATDSLASIDVWRTYYALIA